MHTGSATCISVLAVMICILVVPRIMVCILVVPHVLCGL